MGTLGGLVLIVAIILIAGVIAYLGDRVGHQIGRIEPLSRSERSGGKIVPRYKQKGPFELDRQRRNVAWIANAWHGAARRTAIALPHAPINSITAQNPRLSLW